MSVNVGSHIEILKTRNNGSVGREEVIKLVGNVVRNLDGEASVDLKSPDLAIIVEVSIFRSYVPPASLY